MGDGRANWTILYISLMHPNRNPKTRQCVYQPLRCKIEDARHAWYQAINIKAVKLKRQRNGTRKSHQGKLQMILSRHRRRKSKTETVNARFAPSYDPPSNNETVAMTDTTILLCHEKVALFIFISPAIFPDYCGQRLINSRDEKERMRKREKGEAEEKPHLRMIPITIHAVSAILIFETSSQCFKIKSVKLSPSPQSLFKYFYQEKTLFPEVWLGKSAICLSSLVSHLSPGRRFPLFRNKTRNASY